MNISFIQNVLEFDKSVALFVGSHQTQKLTELFLFITNFANPQSLVSIVVAVVLLFWLFNKREHLLQFVSSIFIAGVVIWVVKNLIARDRPMGGIIQETGHSFPSGHSLISAVMFSVLIYIGKRYIKQSWLRYSFIAFMIIAMLSIGLSRVYLGVHYMSDVIGGFLIGFILSAISILIVDTHHRKNT